MIFRSTLRIVALAAILVGGFGKPFHQHQECGCCSPESVAAAVLCPYGCDDCSWAEQQNAKQSGDHQPRRSPVHDERHCSVCQVLAQAPQVPEVTHAPAVVTFVKFNPLARTVRPTDTRPLVVCSRGPPAAELPAV